MDVPKILLPKQSGTLNSECQSVLSRRRLSGNWDKNLLNLHRLVYMLPPRSRSAQPYSSNVKKLAWTLLYSWRHSGYYVE